MQPSAGDEVREMPELRRRYFNSRKSYATYFEETHATGALDAKTKELMHLALVLALHCEP
jgi:alkylhydroperoxidase/carboxymuconolactone decarboxylase family protein YurZ